VPNEKQWAAGQGGALNKRLTALRTSSALLTVFCLSSVLIAFSCSLLAQSQTVSDTNSASQGKLPLSSKPIHLDVNLALVTVTVMDPYSRQVSGLESDNFRVFEDNVEQEIVNFSSEDVPVSVGIVLDLSGSMSNKVAKAKEAILQFLKTSNPDDEFFLVGFNDHAGLLSSFTNSVQDLQSQLLAVSARGSTALLDAIFLGLSQMRSAHFGKRALLIISDGGDNHSRYSQSDIKRLVREADTQLYAIGIVDPLPYRGRTQEELYGPSLLSDMTELTGGRTFFLDNVNELPDIATKIGTELRNQYILGYHPSNKTQNARWRKIKIKLRPPKGLPPLSVYAKTGYYAPAYSAEPN
jgi:Ca-activated chloride channel homolog